MFTKETKTGNVIIVESTLLGRFLEWITLGLITPSRTYRRNFGGDQERLVDGGDGVFFDITVGGVSHRCTRISDTKHTVEVN